MLHLRLIVPTDAAETVLERLIATPGVAHVARLPRASLDPLGDLVLCDVAREAADELVEWLQDERVHHTGAITIDPIGTIVSDAAEAAERAAPGHGTDSLIWEEVEARARDDAVTTPSLLALMGIAAAIAGVAILLDSPVLVVGAMVVGPDYGPLAALSVAAVRRRWESAARAAWTFALAALAGVLVTLALTLVLRATGLAPEGYDVSDRQLTAFISRPDALAAVVAVLAGVAGMLSLTEARSGTLVGVLVSVTTIPAMANIGVAGAYGAGAEAGGAAAQLVVNVAGLVAAGVLTLVVQARLTTRRRSRA